MSSDLWAAFNDNPESSNSNPWAHQSTTKNDKVAESSNSTQPESGLGNVRTTPQNQTQIPHDDQGNDSDTDSWSAVNQELEDAWTSTSRKPQATISRSPEGAANSRAQNRVTEDELDDDFGDFEEAEAAQNFSQSIAAAPARISTPPGCASLQVDDDFGDFEGPEESNVVPLSGTVARSVENKARDVDPVGSHHIKPNASPAPAQQVGGPASFDPFADLEQLSHPATSTTKVTAAKDLSSRPISKGTKPMDRKAPLLGGFVTVEEHPDHNEEWDDFSTSSSRNEKPQSVEPSFKQEPEALQASKSSETSSGNPGAKPASGSSPANALPPTNVPPPSILIPLVSSIVHDLPEEIGNILKSHEDYQGSMPAISQVLGVLTALEDRMSILKVAARVIAGRKLRWKRDNMLSQSMRISAAGRPGGMKLTGVDKAETKREDREASEFVRMWKANSGRIRGAIMKMPAQADEKPPALPYIAETIAVRTLKEKDGGIKAPKCCVLCGLKREERVDKVDGDVWDQFGEWWIDYWGHTECRNFWNNYEQLLQQR
ncbi:MAG: hypothetical protein MMC23_006535 [Stictis urceolatum]|nr:hypothetical protein [Stictis urceolata]